MKTLSVKSFRLPHDSKYSNGRFFTVLDGKKGDIVYGITDGTHWFRHCYRSETYARQVLTTMGCMTNEQIRVNICTDITYAILTEEK